MRWTGDLVKSLQGVAECPDCLVDPLVLHLGQSTVVESLALPQAREPILQTDFLLTARAFYRLTLLGSRVQSVASCRSTPQEGKMSKDISWILSCRKDFIVSIKIVIEIKSNYNVYQKVLRFYLPFLINLHKIIKNDINFKTPKNAMQV